MQPLHSLSSAQTNSHREKTEVTAIITRVRTVTFTLSAPGSSLDGRFGSV